MNGDQYREMYQKSIDDPAGFWSEIADEFYWEQKWRPDEVCAENLDVTKGPIKIEVGYLFLSFNGCFLWWKDTYRILMVTGVWRSQWFKGGKTNICYNAVDRHVEAGNGDKIAMYWEGNEPSQDGKLTYSELLEKVCQVNIRSLMPKQLHVVLNTMCAELGPSKCVLLCFLIAVELLEKRRRWKG